MTTSITLDNLYQRQITLLGQEGFFKIRASKILVIGAGGLGCPALQYLASAGVGTLGIVDFDRVSASNLQRQILFDLQDIDLSKVEVANKKLEKLAPFTQINQHPVRLTVENAHEIVAAYDVILDCTDNFYTKFLIHDVCFQLKKVLIQAAVYQFEGQMQVFDFTQEQGPCWRCLWEQEPQDGCSGTCAEVGVMGPLLGVMGSMQAMEALKWLTQKPVLKNGETLFFDLIHHGYDLRKFPMRSNCPCCQLKTKMTQESQQIQLPENIQDYVIIDVRNEQEVQSCQVSKQLSYRTTFKNIPLDQLDQLILKPNQNYLTLCARGMRSLKACHQLRLQSPHVYSLIGGVEGLIARSFP